MYDEDINLYGLSQGCPIHGDDNMRECHVCGHEFCKSCFSGSSVCQECAAEREEGLDDDFDDPEPDFEDVSNVGELLELEEGVNGLAEEELVPPDDFVGDDGDDDDEKA